MTIHYLGIDTGGTFTDFYWQGPDGVGCHKVLSTPGAPERAILQGIRELGLDEVMAAGQLHLVHGSTVATNAALEGKGARTAYVANLGFADLLSLGRQNRPHIYALQPEPLAEPVAPELCLGVDCRRNADGTVATPLSSESLQQLIEKIMRLQPESVAINLMFSYLNGAEEKLIAAAMPEGLFVSCSSEVLPEYREYERGVATWLNAWLGPKVAHYLHQLHLATRPSPLVVMQSHGGTMAADQAAWRAVNLLLSGPAGGLAAAHHIGKQSGTTRLLTFDMGGTSTDVALIEGDIKLTNEGRLGPYPLAVPTVDLHTIGAGGGSLAYVDEAGMLHVGPQSAGASPGPACYSRGGDQATVTDANAVLGRLRADQFLGGRMALGLDEAYRVLEPLAVQLRLSVEEAAAGVIALVNEHMARALRVISAQRGYDPADFDLCCFGGAGGLHVCALAEALGMSRILVPANSGVLSAAGMLVAPRQRQLSRTLAKPLADMEDEAIEQGLDELVEEGKKQLRDEGGVYRIDCLASLDCRYVGQSFALNVPWRRSLKMLAQDFHEAHLQRYGHQLQMPLELLNLRVAVRAPAPVTDLQVPSLPEIAGSPVARDVLPGLGEAPIWLRSHLALDQRVIGPAVICESLTTTLVGAGWIAHLDAAGHLRLTRDSRA